MSSTSTRSMLLSTPSTRMRGVEFAPKVFTPRIQNSAEAPGSPVRCMATTPASLPARPVERLPVAWASVPMSTELMDPITDAFLCVPYATFTTSSSSLAAGMSLIVSFVWSPTFTSSSEYPRKEATSTSEGETVMLKRPLSSVIAPLVSPFTTT